MNFFLQIERENFSVSAGDAGIFSRNDGCLSAIGGELFPNFPYAQYNLQHYAQVRLKPGTKRPLRSK